MLCSITSKNRKNTAASKQTPLSHRSHVTDVKKQQPILLRLSLPWFVCYNSYFLMDILSNIKGGVRFLSLSKRTWIFKCWGKHVFLKDAHQLQDNERVKGRKGSRDNFYNSGFRLMATWITMQMAKASNFCQLAKYPEDLLVARALLPSLLCQRPEQWPRSFRADGRSPSRQGLVSCSLSFSPGRPLRVELSTRAAKVPACPTHPHGKHLFLNRTPHTTELGTSSKQKTDGSRCMR